MPKWFNTVSPCKADIHYMLSPLARLPELTKLIAQQLTTSGQYTAIMVSA